MVPDDPRPVKPPAKGAKALKSARLAARWQEVRSRLEGGARSLVPRGRSGLQAIVDRITVEGRKRRQRGLAPREPLRPAQVGEAREQPIDNEEIVMLHDPRSQIAEQFRGLRNSVHALNPDGASHTLVVTSALRGEGKTVAAINLAVAMAELPGTEVLILDADLHHPAVEEYLGLPRRQGLVEVLRGKLPLDQAVRATSVSGVSIMGAGELPPNPSELLGSDRMRSVMNRLRQSYTYVIIDTPEALTISDASLLGAIADGILLVVRLGDTPRHYVEQTHNTLEALGGNVLGTCLTHASVKDTSAGYARER